MINKQASSIRYSKPQPINDAYKAPPGYQPMRQSEVSSSLGRIARKFLERAMSENWAMPSQTFFSYNGKNYAAKFQIHGPSSSIKTNHPGIGLYEKIEYSLPDSGWSGKKLSFDELVGLAKSVGFPNPTLAAAIAMAESGGHPGIYGDPQYGGSIGLWQINLPAHRQYNAEWLKDPVNNANAALAISQQGTNFNPWTTYRTGAYKKYMGKDWQEEYYAGRSKPQSSPQQNQGSAVGRFFTNVEKFLESLAVSDHYEKIISKQADCLITINSTQDYCSKLEFARVVKEALKDQNIHSEIFCDDDNIEIECNYSNKLSKICTAVEKTFSQATTKLGKYKVSCVILPGCHSNYHKLCINLEENYQEFRKKFERAL